MVRLLEAQGVPDSEEDTDEPQVTPLRDEMILTTMIYGCETWTAATKEDLHMLATAQRRIERRKDVRNDAEGPPDQRVAAQRDQGARRHQ